MHSVHLVNWDQKSEVRSQKSEGIKSEGIKLIVLATVPLRSPKLKAPAPLALTVSPANLHRAVGSSLNLPVRFIVWDL